MNFNLISDSLVVQKKSKFIGMLFKIDSKEDVASIMTSYVNSGNILRYPLFFSSENSLSIVLVPTLQ